jgi:hypothetical protein
VSSFFQRLAESIRSKGRANRYWRHTSRDSTNADTVYIEAKAIRDGNNTWAYFTDASEKTIAIQYHYTHIISLHDDESIELVSSYSSQSTSVRWRQYGIDAQAPNAVNDGYVCISDVLVPFVAGIGVRSYPFGPSIPHLKLLLLGSRAGDTSAADRLVTLLRAEGFTDLADIIQSLRGKQWGGRSRATLWEWRDAGEPTEDGRWLGANDSADPVRPMTTRDLAITGVADNATSLRIDGVDYVVINGLSGEPIQGWDNWLDSKKEALR